MCEFMQMIGNLNYMSVNANSKGQKRMCCPPALQLSRHLLLPPEIKHALELTLIMPTNAYLKGLQRGVC